MEYFQIRQNFVELTMSLNLQMLIDELYSQEVLTIYDHDELSNQDRIAQNTLFLLNLQMYDVLNAFAKWLNETNEALYNKICSCKAKNVNITNIQTSVLTKSILERKQGVLRDHLNVRVLAPYLFQEGILCESVFEKVWIEKSRLARFGSLQTVWPMLVRRPHFPYVFETFLNQYQPSLVKKLLC